MAEILCPNCGRSNSDERETCLYCQAQLVAADTGAGASAEENAGGDDWISSLRLGDEIYREEEDQVEWPAQDDEPFSGAAEAERLERIASGPLADTPSDPSNLPETPPDATARADTPDWLKELMQSGPAEAGSESPEDAPEMPPEPAPAAEFPHWLTEFTVPEIAGDPTEDPEQAPEAEPDQLPDWLLALGKAEAEEAFPPVQPPVSAALDPGADEPFDDLEFGEAPEAESHEPDWLAGFIDEPGAVSPAAVPEAGPEEDSQDWLAGFVDDGAFDAKARIEPPQEERTPDILPSWLSGRPELSRESSPEPESDLPPWMSEFEKPGAVNVPEPEASLEAREEMEPAGQAAEPDDEPAWDAGLEALPEAPPEEVPDWLVSALGQVEPESEEDLPIGLGAFAADDRAEEMETGADTDLGDWLSRYDRKSELERDPETGPEPAAEDIPEWLREVNRVESGAAETEEKEGIPDWLRELNEQTPEFETEAAFTAAEPEQEPDALEWMPGAPQSGAFEMLSEAEGIEEDLAPGELPEWLRAMRPIDATAPGVMESGEIDTGSFERVGPLAGLRGVLSAEPVAAQAGRPPSHSVRLQVSDAQQNRSNQLQKMVQGETEPRPAGRRAILSEQRVLRYLIAGLLFFTTILANLVPARMNDLPAKPPEMDAITPLISALTADSVVLIVLDYQPGMSGELDGAAAGILDHVMLQGARLALVSTTPTGPALGERLVRQIEADHGYNPGTQYVNLGYLPGGATGLQLLVNAPLVAVPAGYDDRPFWSLVNQPDSSPWVQPAMQGVTGLGDFNMTLLLSDDPEMVRRWVEQAGPVLRPGTLVVVASLQAEPMVRPYLESGQIAALVPGLRGGAAYEGFLQREGPARSAWDGVTIGTLIAVVLILGAGTYNLYLVWNERELDRKGAVRKGSAR